MDELDSSAKRWPLRIGRGVNMPNRNEINSLSQAMAGLLPDLLEEGGCNLQTDCGWVGPTPGVEPWASPTYLAELEMTMINWNKANNELSQAVLDAGRLEELLYELGCDLRKEDNGLEIRSTCPVHKGDGLN